MRTILNHARTLSLAFPTPRDLCWLPRRKSAFRLILSPLFGTFLFLHEAAAESKKTICIYQESSGITKQAPSIKQIPEQYRSHAKCLDQSRETAGQLAAPQQITLEGSQRQEDMNSSVGRIHLRWERKSERLFGRTPVRAMSDAANTVSRVIRGAAFPSRVQSLSQEWQVVFLGDNISNAQIPLHLITNCHPGWMTPPANIYIVSDRIAGGCSGKRSSSSVADSTLTEVLLHEMGHAIEFQLLGAKNMGGERMRAEGFATFFAQFAARSSSVASHSEMERENKALAKQSIEKSSGSFQFQGTAYDYARASMYFTTIERRLGLRGVMQVYEVLSKKQLPLQTAITEAIGWDQKRQESEIRSYLGIP